MEQRGTQNDGKDWPDGISQRAHADHADCETGDQPLRARPIDQPSSRHLTKQRSQSAHGKNQADLNLSPFLRCQIDCDEGAKTGLHVGKKEYEPIKAARASNRGSAAPRHVSSWVASSLNMIDTLRCLRKQVISPVSLRVENPTAPRHRLNR